MAENRGRPGRRGDIRGLRALAVTAVVIDHYAPSWLPGGFIGVDMFFVISGYLIVGQLLTAQQRGERIALLRFYARRVRRIVPAAFLAASATFLVFAVFLNPLQVDLYGRQFVATSVFASNVVVRNQPGGYFAPFDPSPFLHFWSLAVEEQFYLVAPLSLMAAATILRRRAFVFSLIGIVTLLSLAGATLLVSSLPGFTFFMLPGRAWEFGVGALASALPPLARGVAPTRVAGLVLAVAPMFLLGAASGVPGVAVLPVVLGTAALLAAGRGSEQVRGARSLAPVRYVGDISYSVYLWHWPPICFLLIEADRDRPSVASSLIALTVGLVLAVASYHLVERPIHASGWLLVRPWATLLGAATVGLALIVAGVVLPAWTPLSTSRPAAELSVETVLAGPVRGPGYVPVNASPDLRHLLGLNRLYPRCHDGVGDARLNPCVFGDARARRSVVMAGDSHSAHWLDALDRSSQALRFRLISLTKSSCPPISLPYRTRQDTACATWQRNVGSYLRESRPQVVVFSGYTSIYRPSDVSLSRFEGDVAAGWARTIAEVPIGVRVLVLGDVPTPGSDPSRCLARNLNGSDSCVFVPSVLQRDVEDAERHAVEVAGGRWVDTWPWFCSQQTYCAVQAGNVLVWRDAAGHLTVPMSILLAPRVSAALRPLLG